MNKGTLLASGFIAGGALMGVVSAVLKFAGKDFFAKEWAETGSAQAVAIVAYLAVAAFLLFSSLRAKAPKKD